MALAILDPELCRKCGKRGQVIKSVKLDAGYRRRRRRCTCGHKWNTYESRGNPLRAIRKLQAALPAKALQPTPEPDQKPAPSPPPARAFKRRSAASSYLLR